MLLVGRVGFGLPWPTSLPGMRQRPAVSQKLILSCSKELSQRPRTFRDAGPLAYRLSRAVMSSQNSITQNRWLRMNHWKCSSSCTWSCRMLELTMSRSSSSLMASRSRLMKVV